jgi:hypothetical protein
MTVRLNDPPLNDTEQLLGSVLKVLLAESDARVLFLCPASQGVAIVQRLRVAISRNRNKLLSKGRRPRRFRLRASFHPETHDGVRHEACVLWLQISDQNQMLQDLEGLMANG